MKTYIIGAGKFAKNLKNSIKNYNNETLDFCGFLDKKKLSKVINDKNFKQKKLKFINGIGNFAYVNYPNKFTKLEKKIDFLKLIHNSANIYENSIIGKGSIVSENVLIKSNVRIGKFCIINSNAVISHDSRVDNFVNISLGAIIAGNVNIGRNSFVGMGSSIIHNCKVGKNVLIGAGSVVLKNIPDNVVVFGNPAKIIKKNNNKIS
jgi:acetyltransferase EpsM